jgi:two-component system, OmpR family, phosphate regulon sensor histidine kinase PhoR
LKPDLFSALTLNDPNRLGSRFDFKLEDDSGMKELTPGKLVAAWCLLMISCPLAFLWLEPDLTPAGENLAFLKLFLILALVNTGGLAVAYALVRRWSLPAEQLESFIAAIPSAETPLPVGGPRALQRLSRAMASMAERVRQVVERANLEAARRHAILACMAEGVLAVDKDLKVIFCNDAFAEAFSTRTPLAEGRTLYEVVREPALRDILGRVVSNGTPEKDRLRLPSAAGRWFEARALPLGNQNRQGAVIVLHDITDIERQEQARKDFVADVSHELRTPLAAIRGYAETLLDGALEDKLHNRRFVEIILSHAVRLNNIASDLLVLSELDSDAPPPGPPGRLSVVDIIESAAHTVQNAAAAKNIRLNLEQCHEASVTGYRFRLEQALVNLLDNAVKFNRPEGEVVVECGPTGNGHVRIAVRDTGIGIPSEDLKRIFERFYRVDKARSRPAGGTGLGLPIVKEVVERMGGTVAVESQLGRGSTFTILLQAA